jgi:hypothetical protein
MVFRGGIKIKKKIKIKNSNGGNSPETLNRNHIFALNLPGEGLSTKGNLC